MATYKFYCQECEEEFEDFRALEEEDETGECVVCGSTEIDRGELVEVECDCGCGEEVVAVEEEEGGCGCC